MHIFPILDFPLRGLIPRPSEVQYLDQYDLYVPKEVSIFINASTWASDGGSVYASCEMLFPLAGGDGPRAATAMRCLEGVVDELYLISSPETRFVAILAPSCTAAVLVMTILIALISSWLAGRLYLLP